jgi:hypothetical protein
MFPAVFRAQAAGMPGIPQAFLSVGANSPLLRLFSSSRFVPDQAIAHPHFSHEIAWPCGVGFQFVPQLAHIDSQVVAVMDMLRPPDFLEHLAMGHHQSEVANEQGEQSVFDR